MKPAIAMSCSRQASTSFSATPFFCASRALCMRWLAGPKRYLKKSNSVGRSGIRGRRGSWSIITSLPLSGRVLAAGADDVLGQPAGPAQQRPATYASRDRALAALEANRPDPRAQRDQVLALVEGDRLDASQLQAVHAQMEQRHHAIRDAVAQ